MIKLFLSLALVLFTSNAYALTVNLSWTASPSVEDVSSYMIYIGSASGDYGEPLPTGSAAAHSTVLDVSCGAPSVYYFAVSAVNTSGMEGPKSVEVPHTFVVPPCAPRDLIVKVSLTVAVTDQGLVFTINPPSGE